jgi:hypothetical protein
MSIDPSSWERPRFTPGGAPAEIRYAVFAPPPATFELPARTYRVGGIPDGIEFSTYGPGEGTAASLRSGLAWDWFSADFPDAANRASRMDSIVSVDGRVDDPPTLDYLRDVVGVVTWLLDSGGVAVYDEIAQSWFSKETFRSTFFEPNEPCWFSHVAIHAFDEPDGTETLRTRGLRKFGRPDVVARGIGSENREVFIDLLNRFIELQALGGVVENGAKIRVRGVEEGFRCRLEDRFDDPEFGGTCVVVAKDGAR